jgi:hypothetical protein
MREKRVEGEEEENVRMRKQGGKGAVRQETKGDLQGLGTPS